MLFSWGKEGNILKMRGVNVGVGKGGDFVTLVLTNAYTMTMVVSVAFLLFKMVTSI